MHGHKGRSGHAWAEVWVGSGAAADTVLSAVARAAGRTAATLAVSRDKETGERWLVLDWELGLYQAEAEKIFGEGSGMSQELAPA